MIEIGGLFGLIFLVLAVMAILKIVGSRASTLRKTIWIILILVFPFVGLLLWLFLGPK